MPALLISNGHSDSGIPGYPRKALCSMMKTKGTEGECFSPPISQVFSLSPKGITQPQNRIPQQNGAKIQEFIFLTQQDFRGKDAAIGSRPRS